MYSATESLPRNSIFQTSINKSHGIAGSLLNIHKEILKIKQIIILSLIYYHCKHLKMIIPKFMNIL